jgi:alpha-1,2-mannosyltransferase
MTGVRQFYLRLLRSDDLNRAFGGPLFVVVLIASSLLLAATWARSDGSLFRFAAGADVAQHEDFAAFYRGGEMAGQGLAAEVYDHGRFIEGLSPENRSLLFLNPPHALLFFEPLAELGYPAARGVFLAVSLLCLVLSVRIIRPAAGFWPYAFVVFSAGTLYSLQLLQLAPVTTFLLSFALLFSRARPVLSGLALCLLTIKPQYGLLVPVYLLAMRDWRAFGVAAFGTVALVAVSLGLYGIAAWQAFFASLVGGVHAAQFQMTQNMIVTVGQSLGKIGAGYDLRMILQVATLFACAPFVWFVARTFRREAAAALSLLAMSLSAPSFLFYDWLIYALALLLLLKASPTWPLSLQALGGLLWTAPVVHDVLMAYHVAAAGAFSAAIPVIVLAVLIRATVLLLERDQGARALPYGNPAKLSM